MTKKRPDSLTLRAIYLFFRILTWFGISVFYRKRLVLGRKNLHFDAPAIVVVNHPSTLLDVLNPGHAIRQDLHFLANYSLFKHPVSNWLLRRLFCIPVKRREDVAEGEQRDNSAAFEASYQLLEKNGVLFIAAEGTSFMNRFVRPLKTGAARIALEAESRYQWKLGLKIVPIGLSYSAPDKFRSEVVINGGAEVRVADWSDLFSTDPNLAVEELTAFLETNLKTLSIHAGDEQGERLLGQLEEMLQNERPLGQKGRFYRSQEICRQYLGKPDLDGMVQDYFAKVKALGLSDQGIASVVQNKRVWGSFLFLLLGAPFFALGYLLWYLPFFIPHWIFKKMNIYIGYSSTVKILSGLFVLPLAMWGMWELGYVLVQSKALAWLFLGAAVGLAYFAEGYLEVWFAYADLRKASRMKQQAPEQYAELIEGRKQIIVKLV